MATDYDAPRGVEESDVDRLQELKTASETKVGQRADVDVDETEAAESFELPGADLSHVALEVEVRAMDTDEFICTRCFLVQHRSQRAEAGVNLCRDCS